MKNTTIKKTITLNKDLVPELEKLAKKENRNFSNLVDTILTKAVKYPDLVLSLK